MKFRSSWGPRFRGSWVPRFLGSRFLGSRFKGSTAICLISAAVLLAACGRTPEPPGTPELRNQRTQEPRNPGTPELRNPGTQEPRNLVAGDPVPPAVLAGARHWERGGAAGNRVLVINFNRSRCAAGESCASAQDKIRELHDEVRAAPTLKASIGMLTLSSDPFDVPAVLRAHADRIGADPDVWRFAALPANQANDVLRRFGASEDVNVTAIVDASGTLVKVYAGDGWTAEELIRDVRSLVLRADPAVLRAYIDGQEALADDDLGEARRAFTRLAAAVGEPAVSRLAKQAASAPDLAGARAAYKPLSEALVRLPWPAAYQPMYCPMFEGNAGATWVQKAGPVANPYYGKAMPRCGTDLTAGAHADHSPKFGGVLFMAPNQYHHIEGTYTQDGIFRVRVYDNFSRSMKVTGFRGMVELGEHGRTVRLVPASNGMTLDARVGKLKFPAELSLSLTLDPRGPEERFDFVFANYQGS
jgi:hypothetical protein